MIDRRRDPRPTSVPRYIPSSSGPRCVIDFVIAARTPGSTGVAPWTRTRPQMPHMFTLHLSGDNAEAPPAVTIVPFEGDLLRARVTKPRGDLSVRQIEGDRRVQVIEH